MKKFLFSHTHVTLTEGQGKLHLYQNVEYNSIYHYAKFESNPFTNIWMHANVTEDSRAPPLLTRWRGCGRLRRLCHCSWQEARVAVAVGAFVSSLSEHVSPEQPGGAPLVEHWIATSGMFLGMGPALNCDQRMFRLQLRCSGGTSNLSVDAGLRGQHSFSLHADGFEGWCSPRCFGP